MSVSLFPCITYVTKKCNICISLHLRDLFFFFFFCLDSPSWTLSSSKIALHCSRSCYLPLQFFMPIFFRSSSTESNHFDLDFRVRRVLSGLWGVIFLQGSSSCVLQRYSSHLNLPILPPQLRLLRCGTNKAHCCMFWEIAQITLYYLVFNGKRTWWNTYRYREIKKYCVRRNCVYFYVHNW